MRKESLHPVHILVMSGQSDDAERRARQMDSAGWRTIAVAEPIEALSAVRNQHVDLAMLHLPVDDMLAMDLPCILRSITTATYLPVIILADSPAERDRCRFLDSGADDVICQSTSQAETIARVRAMLRVKDLHDRLAASRLALQEALRRERKLLTKLRKDNAHLQALVTTDPLTHVQNRRSFREILDHEFKMARRYDQPLGLLALDVDHFKVVNDSHGHPSGDYVLKELAVILTRSVRESDVVARTGGEEFCVLLPRANAAQAAQFAERIRQEVSARVFAVYGQSIHVTISIGLASWPSDAEIVEADMLVYFADQALLTAKETGRDRVVATRDLDPAVRIRLRRQYQAMPLAGEASEDSEEAQPCPGILEAIGNDTI